MSRSRAFLPCSFSGLRHGARRMRMTGPARQSPVPSLTVGLLKQGGNDVYLWVVQQV